jgi:hypothetical protein
MRRSSGAERVFEDRTGRLWSAGPARIPADAGDEEDALLFICVSEVRESPRAITFPQGFRLADAEAEVLAALLAEAPKIARL